MLQTEVKTQNISGEFPNLTLRLYSLMRPCHFDASIRALNLATGSDIDEFKMNSRSVRVEFASQDRKCSILVS